MVPSPPANTDAVVFDLEVYMAALAVVSDHGMLGRSMLVDVNQRFLGNPVKRCLDLGPCPGHVFVTLELNAGGTFGQIDPLSTN